MTFAPVDLEFSTACVKDYVAIRNPDTGSEIMRVCNVVCEPQVTLITHRADVIFHSDSEVEQGGFRIDFFLSNTGILEYFSSYMKIQQCIC